ncbi:MAG TPA: thioredoxin family protein [Candidatus Saccharimonadales bacterium]|nr:thioredoxin family protein [Candidatus Saccharimonadales bacterium]
MDSMDDARLFNVAPYRAPELAGNRQWFNSPPLKLADLKGKVVLIDFWTYSCINCIRTFPYIEAWYEAYKDSGLVVIGVHSPEFEFEKVAANVERSVKFNKLTYPIVQDNDMAIWTSFANHYWPAHYLIDADGRVRREHFGEGEYDQTEKAIRALLAEAGAKTSKNMTVSGQVHVPVDVGQTPETYLGYERGRNFANVFQFKEDKAVGYTLMDKIDQDEWTLGGIWQIGAEDSHSEADNAVLRIKFSAKEVYLVMDGPKDGAVTLKIDGKAVTKNRGGGADMAEGGRVPLDGARLYRLIDLPVFTKGAVLDITVPKGTTVNAFTFGS